ncbi:MAG: hypothetical protein IPG04_31680 [Polyangiaceae bacterium]|nr:hypothetical protein [Polyangiaceae bacterium]
MQNGSDHAPSIAAASEASMESQSTRPRQDGRRFGISASGEEERLTPEQERLVAASTVIPRLVPKVARRTTLYEAPELTSLAYLSLRRAARNFKREKGVPFDGYAYRFVHKDLMRAIEEEHEHHKREQVSSFDAAYDHLERATDPGDIWKDTPGDSRRHVAEFAERVGQGRGSARHLERHRST